MFCSSSATFGSSMSWKGVSKDKVPKARLFKDIMIYSTQYMSCISFCKQYRTITIHLKLFQLNVICDKALVDNYIDLKLLLVNCYLFRVFFLFSLLKYFPQLVSSYTFRISIYQESFNYMVNHFEDRLKKISSRVLEIRLNLSLSLKA